MLGVYQIVEVDQFLISVVDRRTGEGSLLVAWNAGPRDVVLAVRQLNIKNVHRHRADVGSIARHVLASAGRPEVVVCGMILRATGGSQRRCESRRGPVACGYRGKERGGDPLGRQSILLTRTLIASEDKQLVFDDRAAQRAAELILVQNLLGGGAGRVVAIVEEIIRVEDGVAQELKRGPVKLVRAGLRNDVDVGAGVPAVACIVSRGLNLELLD